MAAAAHTLGPTCAFFEEDPPLPLNDNIPPPVRARFFYTSTLPIDDPLSPLAPIDSKNTQPPPKPFSAQDSAALEEAWQALEKKKPSNKANATTARSDHHAELFRFPKFKGGKEKIGKEPPVFTEEAIQESSSQEEHDGLAGRRDAEKQSDQSMNDTQVAHKSTPAQPESDFRNVSAREGGHASDTKREQVRADTTGSLEKPWTTSALGNSDEPKSQPAAEEHSSRPTSAVYEDSAGSDLGKKTKSAEVIEKQYQKLPRPPHSRNTTSQSVKRKDNPLPDCCEPIEPQPLAAQNIRHESQILLEQNSEADSSQVRPLIRQELKTAKEAPKHKRHLSPFRHRKKDRDQHSPDTPISSASSAQTEQLGGAALDGRSGRPFARLPTYRRTPNVVTDGPVDSASDSDQSTPRRFGLQRTKTEDKIFIPVGVSRLHLVEFPNMVMKPIYWNPINDISNVVRGTWFYAHTMLPVEQEVADRLETGYDRMKPWTQAWKEEYDVCINVADAAAESKMIYRLWEQDEAVPDASGNVTPEKRQGSTRQLYQSYSVVYANGKEAQLLRPNQLPSVKKGRRPLSAILKKREIGVPVVRGFDSTAYYKSAGSDRKITPRSAQAKVGGFMNQSGSATTPAACPRCDPEVPQVTDLVLVIHGIGQKLSERVDSYHFTHAINGFRREVNVEMAGLAAAGVLPPEAMGLMILPVNWRLKVDFEDGKATSGVGDAKFELSDITPDSLPSIRNMTSDVLLDIPYYLSHHKDKMTTAVIKEANRVYQLWCRNNPGFRENGKVHIIAHSLGSVMALDILSAQPTKVVPRKSKNSKVINETHFDFDTTTLFTCGSPCGLFLLLNKGRLIPRKGLARPGMEGEDIGVSGDAGTYGCLAVKNSFNIVQRNDPVAYLQNACIDANYANSLVPAYIPSASKGLLQKMSAMVWSSSAATPAEYQRSSKNVSGARPLLNSLPSQVELDTHNFTREELAEKRAYLLNDNGQVDYFLHPLGNIQYLDMLGAHSSYWISQDFVRFLVMEIGREPGRANTLPVLRAQKKRDWRKGSMK